MNRSTHTFAISGSAEELAEAISDMEANGWRVRQLEQSFERVGLISRSTGWLVVMEKSDSDEDALLELLREEPLPPKRILEDDEELLDVLRSLGIGSDELAGLQIIGTNAEEAGRSLHTFIRSQLEEE